MVERLGLHALGEVILEYAYPGLKKLEDEGVIEISAISGRGDLSDRITKLTDRAKRYPKERDSISDIISRLTGTGKKINYYPTNAGGIDPGFLGDVGIVYLATPTNIRADPIAQIANAEKGLVIEKPLAQTRGKLADVSDIVRRNRIKAICAEHYSYKDPALELFKNFEARTENFGKIISIEGILEEKDVLDSERYKWLLDPSLSGGGIWLDTGVHMMHLLYGTGARVNEFRDSRKSSYVFPTGDKRNDWIKSETAADVSFSLTDSGRVTPLSKANIRVGKCMPKDVKHFQVSFEKGEVYLDFMRNSVSYIDRRTGKTDTVTFEKSNPYYNMMKAFVNYCHGGAEPPTTINRTRESTDAVFLAYLHMQDVDWRQYY